MDLTNSFSLPTRTFYCYHWGVTQWYRGGNKLWKVPGWSLVTSKKEILYIKWKLAMHCNFSQNISFIIVFCRDEKYLFTNFIRQLLLAALHSFPPGKCVLKLYIFQLFIKMFANQLLFHYFCFKWCSVLETKSIRTLQLIR